MILTSGLIVLRHCFGRLRAVRFDSIEDRRRHTLPRGVSREQGARCLRLNPMSQLDP
jgi:hypothetical protein